MKSNNSKFKKSVGSHLPPIKPVGIKSLSNEWETRILEARSNSKEEHISVIFDVFGKKKF